MSDPTTGMFMPVVAFIIQNEIDNKKAKPGY